jgi:SRSO17 transposase
MFKELLRAATERLLELHRDFQGLFGRIEAQRHSLTYLRGLLTCPGAKTCEAIALNCNFAANGAPAGRKEVVAMQHFISNSPWDYQAVQEKIQEWFATKLAPSAAGSAVGTVLVIDETGDEKSGPHSCGAASQWFGRYGKTENCQIGVFAVGVTPAGTALLHQRLFLPQAWANDPARRDKCHVPETVAFRTKPQIAAELVTEILAAGKVSLDWVVADALYGDSGEFLDALEQRGLKYVVEVRGNTTVFTADPSTLIPAYSGRGRHPQQPPRDARRSVADITAQLPAEAWRPIVLREGSKGPLVAEFARVRIWMVRHGRPHVAGWLLVRRDLDTGELHYFLSNAPADVALETLALVSAARWRVEEFFENAKGHLGLADYEVRGWPSWHHHVTLVGLAHLYVTLTQRDLGRAAPELSLDRAMHLIQAALTVPQLTPEHAEHLAEYYLHHNRIAHDSHRKSWLLKHPELKDKVWL